MNVMACTSIESALQHMACCPVTAVSPTGLPSRNGYTCFVSSNRLIFHPSRVLTPVLLMPYFVLCTVGLLRDYARSSGLTMGAIVTRALNAFVAALKQHG
jgi:hypothetical protein